MHRTIWGLVAIIALAAPAVQAQDGRQVLQDTFGKYTQFASLGIAGSVTMTTEGNPRTTHTPFTLYLDGQTKYRWATLPGTARERVVARDGGTLVQYYAVLDQYVEGPLGTQQVPPPSSLGKWLLGTSGDSVPGLRPIPDDAEVALSAERDEAQLVRVVTVSTEKTTTICRIDVGSGLIASIERRDRVPAGDKTVVQTMLERYDYQKAMPGMVKFSPPATARKVEQIAPETVSFTGKPVPDFRLLSATGEFIELKALRGRVVMLNFWAPW